MSAVEQVDAGAAVAAVEQSRHVSADEVAGDRVAGRRRVGVAVDHDPV